MLVDVLYGDIISFTFLLRRSFENVLQDNSNFFGFGAIFFPQGKANFLIFDQKNLVYID